MVYVSKIPCISLECKNWARVNLHKLNYMQLEKRFLWSVYLYLIAYFTYQPLLLNWAEQLYKTGSVPWPWLTDMLRPYCRFRQVLISSQRYNEPEYSCNTEVRPSSYKPPCGPFDAQCGIHNVSDLVPGQAVSANCNLPWIFFKYMPSNGSA